MAIRHAAGKMPRSVQSFDLGPSSRRNHEHFPETGVGPAARLRSCGDDNEIDHNTFRDKDTEGQMLFIQGPGTTMCKRNWVHHNLFLDFRNSHKNNASGLHIGSSHRSMDSGFSVVEYNLFVRNVGEN